MAVSPVDGSLYISDHEQRRVLRLVTDDIGSMPRNSDAGGSRIVEMIAGSGRVCVGSADNQCGDGKLAVNAALSHPKGASAQLSH